MRAIANVPYHFPRLAVRVYGVRSGSGSCREKKANEEGIHESCPVPASVAACERRFVAFPPPSASTHPTDRPTGHSFRQN